MSIESKISTAVARIETAVSIHKPIAVFGLFSGGHDSFSAMYVASLAHKHFTGALHINTGFGVEATRDYVRQTCEARRCPLWEYRAEDNTVARGKHKGEPDPQRYEDLVRKYGFPGPHGHGMMYARLKDRQLKRLERDFGASSPKRRVMYISGCRSEESERRMANTEEVQVDGRRIWCAPIHDWTKLDTTDCLEFAKQPRNPVVDLIHKSGECLCGAFAKDGELEELALWDLALCMNVSFGCRRKLFRSSVVDGENVPQKTNGQGSCLHLSVSHFSHFAGVVTRHKGIVRNERGNCEETRDSSKRLDASCVSDAFRRRIRTETSLDVA